MRILYLTQWFEPEPNIVKGIAFVRALEQAGHEVTVVTGFPNYPTGRLYPGYRLSWISHETIDGVRVVRLPLYPSHDASALRRSLNFLSFFLSALIYCLLRSGRFDLAYAYHPPITVGLAAALGGWLRRLPFLLDVQDLWPDTIAATGIPGARRLERPVGLLCHFVYRRAAAIIVQAEGMRKALIERGVPETKLTTIRNWANAEASHLDSPSRLREGLGVGARPARDAPAPSPLQAHPWPEARDSGRPLPQAGGEIETLDPTPAPSPAASSSFEVVYGGNFGRAQGLETVVDAAAILALTRQDIELRLLGDGVDAEALQERANGVPGIRLEDPVPQEEILRIFAGADALLLHLRDEALFAITIPSKTQVYLALGRPIVAAVAGEAAKLLAESGAALVVPPGNPDALAGAICQLADLPMERRKEMGAAGRRYYREHLSFERAMAETARLIDGVGARARPQ